MAKTILLADDSLTIQKVVELTFADTDFEVVSTSSGDELLGRLAETAPDIVVCDTIMPGTDGYDVCQKIKSDPRSLHIPVIMLTGTFEPFDRDRALAVGCSEIITKPFEARKLVETVQNLSEGFGVAAPAPRTVGGETETREFEGAVAPPAFEGAVAPPVEEAYGTMMADSTELEEVGSAPDDGLDFTSTGFAAMEAAGEASESMSPAVPDHGLDFQQPEAAPEGVFGIEDQPPVDETQPIPAEELAAAHQGVEEDHWAEPSGGEAEAEEAVAHPPIAGEDEEIDTVPPEVFATAEHLVEEAVEIHSTDAVDAIEAVTETDEIVTTPDFQEPDADVPTELEALPETGAFEEEPAFEAKPETPEADMPAPTFEAPAVEEPEPEEIPVPDSQPAPVGAGLSDEDVDRIARRVVELAADRLEKIAWDVIPDMAEIVVRERIRELEAQLEEDNSVH